MLPRTLLLSTLLIASLAGREVSAETADLSVSLSMAASVIQHGTRLFVSGQITVTNAGPDAAQNVTIDLSPGTWSIPGFNCFVQGYQTRCSSVSLALGSATGSLNTDWTGAVNGTVETTTATISASTNDPATSNNSSSVTTSVVWNADLRLTGVSTGMAAPGAATTVEANFHNSGPSPAGDFQITVSLPAGTT